MDDFDSVDPNFGEELNSRSIKDIKIKREHMPQFFLDSFY